MVLSLGDLRLCLVFVMVCGQRTFALSAYLKENLQGGFRARQVNVLKQRQI